jgi:hypothetical protein
MAELVGAVTKITKGFLEINSISIGKQCFFLCKAVSCELGNLLILYIQDSAGLKYKIVFHWKLTYSTYLKCAVL